MKKKYGRIYVIILNYNSSEDTLELYASLQFLDRKKFRVIIVDNKSTDLEIENLKNKVPFEDLVLNKKNLGFAEGNRVALEMALNNKADYALLLNPDIRINIGSIERLFNLMKVDSNLAVVGPRICYREEPHRIYSDGGLVFREQGYFTNHLNSEKLISEALNPMLHCVDYVNGSCFLLNLDILKKIGFMRKEFFMYFEETEWCLRANKNGFRCKVDSEIVAYHKSSSKNDFYYYYMIRNRILLARMEDKYVLKTYLNVLSPILKDLFISLKKIRKPRPISRVKLKALIDGTFIRI